MTYRDSVFEAIKQNRKKSTLLRLIDSPLHTIREKRYLLYLISALGAIASAAVAFYMGMDPTNIGILAFVLAIIPPSLFNLFETNRIRKLEAEFPALMRDVSLSLKSGMTIEEATRIAAAGQYGSLTPAVKQIDSMVSWGIPFDESWLNFAKKYPTSLIRRAVFTLVEASRMGGQLSNILQSVAADVEQTKSLEKRRNSETKPYITICYVSFFVFLLVIMIISRVFLPMMQKAADTAGGVNLPSGLGQFAVSGQDTALYNRLFFHALVIQGFFAGMVTGKIGEGKAVAGLKHSVLFIVIAVIVYAVLM